MFADFLFERFREQKEDDAIVWRDRTFSYAWLLDRLARWRGFLDENGVDRGAVVAVEADFSPSSVALLLALIDRVCTIVPLTSSVERKKGDFKRIAEVECSIVIETDDEPRFDRSGPTASHPLYRKLRADGHPGLVLFSSGSTGESKAALHDLCGILEKFKVRKRRMRAITFLLFDHIGGVNTLFYQLSNGGCCVTVSDRSPDSVLAAVERHKVELLPASPTFFNLILLSEAHRNHDLSSLQVMTYGTEPMQESVLRRFHAVLPRVKLQQTYGLSELGILRSKSKSSDSLWVKIGGEGFETRIVDGTLRIKARSAMLGYLNHPSPFSEDGWFDTGDLVEAEGEFVRFLGRKSEIINVGGEKVHPAEVESVIQELDEIVEASVYGEKNPITGSVVCAVVSPAASADPKALPMIVKKHCAGKLQPFKVPVRVRIADRDLHTARFKKTRKPDEP